MRSIEDALALSEKAGGLESLGDLKGAAAFLQQAIAIFIEIDGHHSPDTANLLQLLGAILNRSGSVR
jgi:hypothetical protein